MKMEPKNFYELIYSKIEEQHERLDDIVQNLNRFNPIRVKAGVGDVINAQHEMKDSVMENIKAGDFKGFIEHISKSYSAGGLYKAYADHDSKNIPSVLFTEAFVEEARGILYYATVLLTDSAIPNLEGNDKKHYMLFAMNNALQCLEKAVIMTTETVLAKGLLHGAKTHYKKLVNE